MSGRDIAGSRTSLHAIVVNRLPDILVQDIAIDAPRKWEKQERRPVQSSYQAAAQSNIVEPVRLSNSDTHTRTHNAPGKILAS